MKAEVYSIVFPWQNAKPLTLRSIGKVMGEVGEVTHLEVLFVCRPDANWQEVVALVKEVRGARAIRIGHAAGIRELVYIGLDQSIGDVVRIVVRPEDAVASTRDVSPCLSALTRHGGSLSRAAVGEAVMRLHATKAAPGVATWMAAAACVLLLWASLGARSYGLWTLAGLVGAFAVGYVIARFGSRPALGDYQVTNEELFVSPIPGKADQLNVVWESPKAQ